MAMDLLWLELVLKGVMGCVLLVFPRTFARILGLPPVGETFWPRLLGAMLIGLALATLFEGQLAAKNGLGLAGHVAVNLVMALALIAFIILGRAGPSWRGRVAVGLAAAALSVLALVELAWV
jgi:ABC-type uncharacterized transport system permease subunit